MYRDIHFSTEKNAIVTTAGVVVVPNVTEQESFALLNECGELEKRMEADREAAAHVS